MRYFLAFLLLTSVPAFGQRNLTKESFRASVRPILSGILNDFYQMISLFPDYPREIIGIVDEMEKLSVSKENLRSHCPRVLEAKCLPDMKQIQERLNELSAKGLALKSKLRMSSTLYIGNISGLRILNDFESKLQEVKGVFDNKSFLIKAKINDKKETYPLILDLDEMNTLISLALVEFIPFTYKEDFRHFYFNFVHPIVININKNQNYEFLNRNVNSLNFALNLLNMNLTKRNKKTPDGMAPYLATIHNRWNSILRYYF